MRQTEASRQHLGLKRTGFVEKHRLWLLPQAIQELVQFFGRHVVVEIVVYLDGGGPGTGAHALFDGVSLKGWKRSPRALNQPSLGIWTVEDGVISGGQDP